MAARASLAAVPLVTALILAGCSGDDRADDAGRSPSPPVDSGTSETAAEAVETEDDVDIGDGSLFLRCWGEKVPGEPSVLLMSGFGLLTSSWELMAAEFAAEGHHLCAYDRRGVGRSDSPPPDARRTTKDLVDDVVALLDGAGLQEPVVVTAHSMGSLPAIGLVHRAPERVAGVVLVDPLSPRVSAVQRELLPPETPDEPPVIAEERTFLEGFLRDPTQNPERLLLAESEDQVAEMLDEPGPVFGDLPVVVLEAPYPPPPAGLPRGYARATVTARDDGNREFAAESTQGTVVEVEDSGHHIQDDRPDVVMDAIREVIAGS